ncbi:MAG: carboxypeptidase-like regulatory domain-containing protein [Spirochaetia bacterium]
MKMKRVIQVMIVLAAAVTIGIIAGCEISVDQLPPAPVTYSISGTLIDAKVDPEDEDATAEIEGTALTLTDSEGTEAGTAETGEDGTFTFTGIDSGDYAINAVLDTYAFIEKEVTVKGEDVTGVNMLGFPAPDPETISIFVVWSDEYADIDAHITYPDDYYGGSNPPELSDPYAEPPTNNGYTYPNSGDPDYRREVVYFVDTGSTSTFESLGWDAADGTGPVVELDRDDRDGSGPETITIGAIPVDYYPSNPALTTTGDTSNMLTTDETYAWVGSMEYFLDSFSATGGSTADDSTLSTEGEAGDTEATVYVTQGSEVKGRYTIPDYTTINQAAVLRINMLVDDEETELFQIVPDLEIVPPGIGIKGIGNEAGILLLEGKTR